MFLKILIFLCTIDFELKIILAHAYKRPNIVMMVADDLGFYDVSYRGGNHLVTPNIDALAFNGKIITNMYAPPMCTPSRAALLSGRYPIHTGSQHFVLLNDEPYGMLENITNMAEIFQDQGYSTNLIGKWHLGMARKEYAPNNKGFDYFYGYLGGFVGYYDRRSRMPFNYSLGYDFRRNLDMVCAPEGSYVTDLLTNEAIDVIAKHNTKKPLFLMVNHLAPHTGNNEQPLAAPQEEIDKFDYISDENKRTYAAMISKLDDSLGRIIKALDKRDLLKNSIIVFCSDNGAPTRGLFSNGGSNWPFRGQKNSPWEGALRVPAVIWSPFFKLQSSIYQPVMHMSDLLPTFAAAARIPLNSYNLNLDGINHWPDLVYSSPNYASPIHKTREIVHALDEIEQISSFMQGRFKYIKGTTINGSFDDWLSMRNVKELDPRIGKYAQVVQSSLAGKALTKYNRNYLSANKIETLRRQAEIKCGQQVEVPCSPLEEECLFDIWQDPCEKTNLARNPQYSEVLDKIKIRLDELKATAIAPRTGGALADYDPSRYGCRWTYFLEERKSNVTLDCDYNSPPCQFWEQTDLKGFNQWH